MRILTDDNGLFCPTCWEMSPRVQRPFCSICGRPHEGSVGFGPPANYPCSDCRAQKESTRAFNRIYGAAIYEGPIAETIKLLKFNDRPRAARPLTALMRDFMSQELDCAAYSAVVAVPLHRVRRRARGFNQAELLAQQLLPALPNARWLDALRRIRPTRTQSWLKSPRARMENVKGAFAVQDADGVSGATILLVDDVVTTAVTVNECARVLRAAGALHVDVLAAAVARGPGAAGAMSREGW